MSYSVHAVTDARRLRDFLRLPFALYRDDPAWVAPVISEVKRTLDMKRNPYFAQASLRLYICYKDETPAARLAVVINKLHQKTFGVRSAFFGFFESANDGEAVNGLVQETERYCRAQGAQVLEGPFNPNHYSEVGLKIDRFGTAPVFFEPYNPSYYAALLEKAGFRVSAVFQSMRNDDIRNYLLGRFGGPAAQAAKNGYTVRSFSLADKERDLERIREVNNDAFAGNWHFLPLTKEEYTFSAKYLSLVTRPDLIKIVEHDGRPAAVLHCVLDINPLLKRLNGKVGPVKVLRFQRDRRRIKNLIIYSVAIKKAYQHSRVYHLLLKEFCRMARDFETAETTWVSPQNVPSVRAAESLGMTPDKHFAIYEKGLGS
jgi:hypothetical protein